MFASWSIIVSAKHILVTDRTNNGYKWARAGHWRNQQSKLFACWEQAKDLYLAPAFCLLFLEIPRIRHLSCHGTFILGKASMLVTRNLKSLSLNHGTTWHNCNWSGKLIWLDPCLTRQITNVIAWKVLLWWLIRNVKTELLDLSWILDDGANSFF